jgi:guanylate kinase
MNIQELIEQYKPDERITDLVRTTKITLLVGISGAGKDTIKKELLKQPEFRDIISHTTRAPRSNNGLHEVEGVDYHFVTNEIAGTMLESRQFIEAKFVHGTVYGTSANELQKAHDEDKIAVTDLDVQGVKEYKDFSQEVVAIFIIPPSFSVWQERLSARYESMEAFNAEWQKRRDSAIKELTHALQVPYYHFVINDSLDRVVQVIVEIAHRRHDAFHRKDDEARLRARDLLEDIKASV